eukprot:TRINITY_DN11466_c0_g1_i1.p1 TRINITY_DN11466_c0_g1~~TRINITY_DN11466_c0_g1_i1.p1  ORF type:complete len:256 (+),score=7.40 TRINITY_DN11466_c0_g1_i1:251-1018(+)
MAATESKNPADNNNNNPSNAAGTEWENEGPRLSLLEVVNERFNEHRHLRTSRIVYVGTLGQDVNPTDVVDFHLQFIDNAKKKDVSITGVALVVNRWAFVFIEGPMRSLMVLLRELSERCKSTPPLFSAIRICNSQEEVYREHRFFTYRYMQLGRAENDDYKRQDPSALILEMLKSTVELGRELSKMDEMGNALTYLNSNRHAIVQKLPTTPDVIAYLVLLEILMTLEEYLQLFDTPVHFTLESELVWPVEPFLKY